MGDTAFGVLVITTIFFVMGGMGLIAAWPQLKRIGKRHVQKHT